MTEQEIRDLGPAFANYLAGFRDCFLQKRTAAHFDTYCRGLLSELPRKSIEPIALAAGTAVRTLQEFLATATWDHPQGRNRGASREHPQGPRRPQRTHDPTRPTVSRPFPVARSVLAGPVATVIGGMLPRSTGAVAGGLVAGLAVVRWDRGRCGAGPGSAAGQAPEGSLVAIWRAATPAHVGRRHGPVRPPAPRCGAPGTPPARRRR